jgi:hypothetical protein
MVSSVLGVAIVFQNEVDKGREPTRWSSRTIVAILVLLAVLSRLAAVFVLQSHLVPRSTYEHGEIAANLLAGRGFTIRFLGAEGPTSQQAPVYPFVVAAAYAMGGVETPRALLLLEIGQSLLGGVLVVGTIRLARHIAPGRPLAAWIAGLIAAIHPTLVYAATHVQVATLGATTLVWSLAMAERTAATGRKSDAAITGGLLSLTALIDPILALASLGVVQALWMGRREARPNAVRFVPLLATTTVVAVLVVTPWIVRNYLVHGEFVAIKSSFGYAFWQGNCAESQGTDKVVRPSVDALLANSDAVDDGSLAAWNRTLWKARHEAGYLDDVVLTQDDYRTLGQVSEPERSRILFRRALTDIWNDPARYAQLCLQRLRYFVFFDETNPKTRSLAYRIPHLGLTLLAVIGLGLTGPTGRRRLRPTLITTAAIAAFHAFTIVSARFHIPIEPLLGLWAGVGLSELKGLPGRIGSPNRSASGPHHVERIRIVDGLEGRLARVLEPSRRP